LEKKNYNIENIWIQKSYEIYNLHVSNHLIYNNTIYIYTDEINLKIRFKNIEFLIFFINIL